MVSPIKRTIYAATFVALLCGGLTMPGVDLMANQPPPKPCQSDNHRAFDFWLGEWRVTTPSRPNWQAASKISLGNDGCSINEAYSTPGGYAGTSVNFYDAGRDQWHQTWVDNQGNPLHLDGGMKDGSMVLSDGTNEITWTLLDDGRVRQHWRNLKAEDESKRTVFDGYYERVAEEE